VTDSELTEAGAAEIPPAPGGQRAPRDFITRASRALHEMREKEPGRKITVGELKAYMRKHDASDP
jgi:hypothetical protein